MKNSKKKRENINILKNFKNHDKILLVCTIILIITGLLNIVTASSRESVIQYDKSLYYYFFRQSVMIIAGIVISMVIINVDTKNYFFLSTILFIGIGILLLVPIISSTVTRGSQGWIKSKFGAFQPSEFTKPILIVFLSCFYEKFKKIFENDNIDGKTSFKQISIAIAFSLIMPILVFLQKDAGTAFIIAVIAGVLFLYSPFSKKKKANAIFYSIGLLLFVASIYVLATGSLFSNEQKSRIFNWFKPCVNYEDGGYQVCNSYIAFNQGGLTGLGLGKSQQKYSYIPEPHTDSVFAIIAEEQGVIKSSIVFILYGILLYRIFKIGIRSKKLRNRYMCIGVATYIFVHIFVNLGGIFGIIPLTGVPLPFFTYGGSFTISLIASIAIIQRINIENKK